MTFPSVSLYLLTLLSFVSFLSCTEPEQPEGQMPEGSLEEQLAYVNDPDNFSSEDERLNTLFELYAESKKRNSPMMATFLGMEGYNHLWDDLSPEGRQQAIDESTAFYEVREIFNADDLNEENQLNYALFQRDVSDSYNLYAQYPEQYLVVDQIQGIHQMIPAVLQMMPQRSEEHLDDLLTRLRGIPALMKNAQRLLEEGIEQEIVMPRTTVVQVPEQVRSMIADDPNKSVFYAPLASLNETIDLEGVDGESVQQEARLLIAEEINPALEQFATFMAKEYVPNARASFGLKDLPNGEAWYDERIRNNTTTDLSAQEIHEIGLSEVARIREAMQQIIDEVAFSGDMQAFNEFLKTDPQFYYDTPEALLTGYREICKRIDPKLPQLFGHLPRLPYGVIEVPAYQAPATTTAYYQPGSIKNGTPGYFFANTYNLKSRPKWGMESLAIHEAVPGHHLQLAIAQEQENVPEFRTMLMFTAFVEGWGLYSESLGPELGMYQDPYSRYGQLTYEIWRAIRLVVDTGLHQMGWTRDQAIAYFRENSSMSEQDVVVEIDRYIAWPGQALAYKIGELKIQELRKKAEESLKDQFDIRSFHDVVLGSGTVPLSVLEDNIVRWLADQKQVATVE
ncbi:MAG: DUF885 domain-containing protein [Tunicatimonas sp.]|uniref:DUF885 domain-containing protein n=1 Tax=Tunicatimonas sp. TaxID=1940096 RepID=UPI003C70C7A0